MIFLNFYNLRDFSNFLLLIIIVGVAFTLKFLVPSIRSFKTKSSISLLLIHFSKSILKPSFFKYFLRLLLISSIVLPFTHSC